MRTLHEWRTTDIGARYKFPHIEMNCSNSLVEQRAPWKWAGKDSWLCHIVNLKSAVKTFRVRGVISILVAHDSHYLNEIAAAKFAILTDHKGEK